MLTHLSVSTLPSVEFEGQYFVLGCLPPDPVCALPFWDEANTTLPESQWQEIDLSGFVEAILNQGMTSSCVGHGSASGMAVAWAQAGKPKMGFSPYFIYGNINGGRDQGAIISHALTSMQTDGVAPRDVMPAGVMYRQQFPAAAVQAAQRFKLFKAYQCPSFERICTALTLGFCVPLGIMVGQNFANVSSEGICPLPNGGGGGHCILGVGLKRHPRYGWLIKILNSWGTQFGMGGYAYITRNHFQYMQVDAFAIQCTTDDPLDNTPADEVPTAI